MSNSLTATDPRKSATVSASAGTGKTWLLVTRLIRLLLSGNRPDGILAVTFTRKAAAEMQTRLNQRLLEMAKCSDQDLDSLLSKIDVKVDDDTRQKARTLYETLLSSPHSIRTSTFHSFCQDILRKFPMEAGIAPGFELQENTQDLRQSAWNAVCAEASKSPEGELAKALEDLIDACGGLTNTTTAINSFLDYRSDWWAFTEGQENPLSYAVDTLTEQLNFDPAENPEKAFFNTTNIEILAEFISLLGKHPGAQNNKAIDALTISTDPSFDFRYRFSKTIEAFLTQKGEPLKRKESGAQENSMGKTGQLRFLEIHQLMCETISKTLEKINTRDAFLRINTWYRAGSEVLEHYQNLKNELRVLDFSDLEWRAYLLLNHSNNVHWIQYKLDQRIDHLLVDEFQDTNPTQWRLILPLLQELAAGETDRQRSVFLVGDNKQSIYRFRRADPELFNTAQSWLGIHLKAISQPLDISWRSAEAIMSFVNRVFCDGPLSAHISNFSRHSTHHRDLWGKVTLLPLIEPLDEKAAVPEKSAGLRDPLITPLVKERDQGHLKEGHQIAGCINDLVKQETLVGEAGHARPVQYGDIIILVRNRTHVEDYEQALRLAGIPYVGADRGTLLNSLEIRDLVNLLELLIMPFNNLAMANVLRSPIFNCSSEDLISLAIQKERNWIDKLSALASMQGKDNRNVSENLFRAYSLLSQWKELAGKLPVHDLLDRIYNQGDVINRYRAAYPSHLTQRVIANLIRFIELALEIDSGRHPTIGRFVSRLHNLRQQEKEAPDEGSPVEANSRVRILTIHASKGLEAPVVFLADTAFSSRDKTAYRAIVDWPTDLGRPDCFLLSGKKDSHDPFTVSIMQRHTIAEEREDANLLYVALTRAKQLLYISGCKPGKGQGHGWYGIISEQCYDESTTSLLTFESGNYPEAACVRAPVAMSTVEINPLLSQPLQSEEKEYIIAPSYHTGTLNQISREYNEINSEFLREEALTRGITIHRCLQILCEKEPGTYSSTNLLSLLSSDPDIVKDEIALQDCIDEALHLHNHEELSRIFNSNMYQSAYNEVPIQYYKNNQMVYGIIDRVVVTDKEVWVIDYKTHRVPDKDHLTDLKDQYRSQIEHYCLGTSKLWPGKEPRGFLLFTHYAELQDLNISLH